MDPNHQEAAAKNSMDALDFGGQDQDRFLSRIRARRSQNGPPEPHPGSSEWPSDHERQFTYEEKAKAFTQALEKLGGRVLRAATAMDGYTQVCDLLVERRAGRVLVSGGDWSACESLLREARIVVDRWDSIAFGHGEAGRDPSLANAWDAGLMRADYAVADLGSIAVVSTAEQGRSVSLVPPVHVAFVSADSLVYSRRAVLEDVSRRSKRSGVPSSLTFITGPSRSADIEMDLSVGVHGPGEVIAVLVDQDSDGPR